MDIVSQIHHERQRFRAGASSLAEFRDWLSPITLDVEQYDSDVRRLVLAIQQELADMEAVMQMREPIRV